MRIGVKILGTKTPQRYAVQRAVLAAKSAMNMDYPDLLVDISEVRELAEIEKFTQVFIYPSLVVNDRLVCIGRFPSKGEILIWLQHAVSTDA